MRARAVDRFWAARITLTLGIAVVASELIRIIKHHPWRQPS